MKDKDNKLIWESYTGDTINEGPPIYVDPSDQRAGGLSDFMSRDGGRGGDSDYGKATKYGKVGKEDEGDTVARINRVAVRIYDILRTEQDERVQSGGDPVSPEKWSNLKLRLLRLAVEENVPATRAKFFMRVIVNAMKQAGIIQVDVKLNQAVVDTPPEDEQEDIATISHGVEQAVEEDPEAKKGFFSKMFGK